MSPTPLKWVIRFFIVLTWLLVGKLLFVLLSNVNTYRAFGWSTWAFYGVTAALAIGAGILMTKNFWSWSAK